MPEEPAVTAPYTHFLAERDEILRFKWLRSEAAGHDIGFERALTEWTSIHRYDGRARANAARLSAAGAGV